MSDPALATFFAEVARDGVEAARARYPDPDKFAGCRLAYEEVAACRDISAFTELRRNANIDAADRGLSQADYRRLRCRELEIEWVANVLSQWRPASGLKAVRTSSGRLKALEIQKRLGDVR